MLKQMIFFPTVISGKSILIQIYNLVSYVKMHIVFLLNKVETSNMLVCSLLKPFKYQECGMKEMALKKILQDLMIQIFSCFSDSN